MVLAVAFAGLAVFQTYRIGDSGSKAAWTDNFNSAPVQDGSGRPGGD